VLTVTLYTGENCTLCDKVIKDLENLQEDYPHRLVQIDIDKENLRAEFGRDIPVVEVGPYRLKAPFDRKTLHMTLGAARDRLDHLEKIDDEEHRKRVNRGSKINPADRFFYWLSKHYIWVINAFVFLYLGLAFLAPILQAQGSIRAANVFYTVYGRLCHQLSFRSWFLFGEQAAYPRAAAGVSGLITYAEATGFNPWDLGVAREFVGNAALGYKIALCQRDVAIYGSMLFFGILYALTGKRIGSLPVGWWLVLGIAPIALDGMSQLISQLPLDFLSVRESTPFLRTLTGALFGFTTAWFGYPLVEETMAETRKVMAVKFAAVRQKEPQE
jgi:uncharacterized membrane protein/thiol-disulfide isomerase/thioredoxin